MHWIHPRDPHHWSAWYGMPWDWDRLEDIAQAAQLRVAYRAGRGGTPLHIAARWRRVELWELNQTNGDFPLLWDSWINRSGICNRARTLEALAAEDVTLDVAEEALTGGMPYPLTKARDKKRRGGLQAWVRGRLEARRSVIAREARIRDKLARHWLPGRPRVLVARACSLLDAVKGKCPPSSPRPSFGLGFWGGAHRADSKAGVGACGDVGSLTT